MKRLTQDGLGLAVGGDIDNPAVGEALMTSEPDPIAAAMAAKDGTKWWLLHRLIMTMAAAGRQKKADEVVKQQRKAEERAKT